MSLHEAQAKSFEPTCVKQNDVVEQSCIICPMVPHGIVPVHVGSAPPASSGTWQASGHRVVSHEVRALEAVAQPPCRSETQSDDMAAEAS